MKFLIILLTFGLIYYSHSKELITTSYSTIEEEKYELENGTVHTNLKTSGLWTNNFGNYGKSKCFGLFTTYKDKSINLNMKCESIDYKGNKTWSVIKKESNEFDAGGGLNKHEDGTSPWKYIIGTECKDSIKYFEDANYSVKKCKLSEKAYQEFSEN